MATALEVAVEKQVVMGGMVEMMVVQVGFRIHDHAESFHVAFVCLGVPVNHGISLVHPGTMTDKLADSK